MNIKKWTLVLSILCLFGIFYIFDLKSYLNFEYLKNESSNLQIQINQLGPTKYLVFFLLYVIVTAASLPGAAVLTLAAGAFFDFVPALLMVSFASSIGALCAFLIARFLLRDWVEEKAGRFLATINQGLKNEGVFYLLTLRLIPAFPFFIVNLVMSLTSIEAWKFYILSQIGMFPGTLLYVNAGRQLSQLNSLSEILSFKILFSLVLLGIFPILSAQILSYLRNRKVYAKFKKPRSYDYNIVVLGGGSAGLITSYIASLLKSKVALIEKSKMGGDCLNTGCVPSKALLASAKIAKHVAISSDYGIQSTIGKIDFQKIMNRVKGVIQKIAPNDSRERYRSLGVECFDGEGNIISPWEVKIGDRILSTRNIVIATGARPIVPKIPGIEAINYLTSENIWELDQLPSKLLIVGGGAIGCELGQAFARLGSVVTIVEQQDQLLSHEDPELSSILIESLKDDRMEIRLNCKVIELKHQTVNSIAICEDSSKNITKIEFSHILFAIGRTPNLNGFGLENLSLKADENGKVVLDNFLRTSLPNIYFCGDVAGKMQFTHAASHYAWYASINALFSPFKKFSLDESLIPRTVYTDPEIACIGLNEKTLIHQQIPHRVFRYDLSHLDRHIAEEHFNKGQIKVILAEKNDKILGVNIIGPRAAELLMEFAILMKHNKGLSALMSVIHPYPSFAEATKFTAGVYKKSTINQVWLEKLSFYHKFRRKYL